MLRQKEIRFGGPDKTPFVTDEGFSLFIRSIFLIEIQGAGVNAISLTRRIRPVVKNMP